MIEDWIAAIIVVPFVALVVVTWLDMVRHQRHEVSPGRTNRHNHRGEEPVNWEEKALTAGESRFINGNESIETWADQKRCELLARAFAEGAKWNRDQLRTDEVVARVANGMHNIDHGETLDHHDAVCERDRGGCDRRETYTDDARSVIAAVLGDAQ